MTLKVAALNQAVDAITVTQMSLHSGAPTDAGTANEISGGSYARQNVAFGAAANGVRTITAPAVFSVAAGTTVAYYVIWDGAVVKDVGQFLQQEVFGNAGTYTVTTATLTASAV